MTKRILTTLLMTTAITQVACGGKKSAAITQFQQQCTEACQQMYAAAAKNAGIVGPAAAASLPQVAAVGAPVLPGQVTNTSLLAASVTDKQVAAQQAKISSQLQAIVTGTPTTTTTTTATPSAGLSVASVSSAPTAVSIGVTRLPASDIAPMTAASATPSEPVTTPPLTSAGSYQPASLDNGSALAAAPVDTSAGAGR